MNTPLTQRSYIRSRFIGLVAVVALAPCAAWGAIGITAKNPLSFATAAPSDPAQLLVPADANAATFEVDDSKNRDYNITLPATATLTHAGGATITVNTFASTPSGTGNTGATGVETLRVGATRLALGATQAVGSYTGTFSVSVQRTSGGTTASTSGTMTISVIASITIAKDTDLDFGEAAQGDPARTIATTDLTAAAFSITGEPNRAFTIQIPADGTVVMTTGAGVSADDRIAVNSFSSSLGSSSTIGAGGTVVPSLKIGAQRPALLTTQTPGNYSGAFTVTVLY